MFGSPTDFSYLCKVMVWKTVSSNIESGSTTTCRIPHDRLPASA